MDEVARVVGFKRGIRRLSCIIGGLCLLAAGAIKGYDYYSTVHMQIAAHEFRWGTAPGHDTIFEEQMKTDQAWREFTIFTLPLFFLVPFLFVHSAGYFVLALRKDTEQRYRYYKNFCLWFALLAFSAVTILEIVGADGSDKAMAVLFCGMAFLLPYTVTRLLGWAVVGFNAEP